MCFSKDVRVGTGSLSCAAPSDAGIKGLVEAELPGLPLLHLLPALCALSRLFDLLLSGGGEGGAILQNCANGMASGMLDLRGVAGKASTGGFDERIVGGPSTETGCDALW